MALVEIARTDASPVPEKTDRATKIAVFEENGVTVIWVEFAVERPNGTYEVRSGTVDPAVAAEIMGGDFGSKMLRAAQNVHTKVTG